nr:ankyrin repeat domain-containing protein [Paludisphaera mucosa]
MAVLGDDPDLTAFLLAREANPDVVTADGYSALLWAVESEAEASTAVLATLIAGGADVNGTGLNGWTPLHMAASRGRVAKARMLLDAGARVDQRATIDGEETPLMEAARGGRPEVVRLLLERGADPSLRDVMLNRSPREIAEDAGFGCNDGIYDYLKENPTPLDADAILDETGIDGEAREQLRSMLANHDMAESYRESADRLAREGGHDEVIWILDEHEARRVGRLRFWLRRRVAFLRRWWSGEIRFSGPYLRWNRPSATDAEGGDDVD